jgi:tape measure domain-containing protein
VSAASIGFDIFARDRNASETFSRVAGNAESAGSRIAKVGKVVGGAMLGVGVVLAGAGIAGAKFGLEVAANNEQAQIAFTTMLGSAKKAGAFLKDLQAFAAKTPFEFPELQTAASSLISAGINANKVIPIMTTLGNVTSGMGTGSEGVQRATVALQQMSAAGRITGEDLNQLRDAGIPVYDLLAKATGKSKEEVVKLAQAGKLGKKELGQMMSALETGKGLERFSGLMDKQSQSLSGMVSTFKDTFGQGLANAIAPSIPLIKDGLGKASEFLAGVLPKVGAGLQVVIKALTVFFQAFAGNSEMNEFDGKLRGINNAGIIAREVFDKIAGAVKKFITEFQNGTGAGGQFRDVLARVVGVAQNVAKWIGQNTTIVGALVSAVVAGIGAFKVITGIVRVFTAVQAALNFVLAANPVGIVIIAIAALAAGLIYAYKNSETFRNIVDSVFRAVAAVARWLWNTIYAPFFRFLINGFATVADWIGNMLDALSHVPGFGWAKTAADKMHGAAGAARGLANNIRDIPDNTIVRVTTVFSYTTSTAGSSAAAERMYAVVHKASGGPVRKGVPYAVGDNPDGSWNATTELFVPDTAGEILNQAQLARKAGAGAAVGGGALVVKILLDGRELRQSQVRIERQDGR